MALRDEIVPYIDGNGLVAPGLAGPNSGRASGNGVMYTCEYYTMLSMRGQLQIQDLIDFASKIDSCISQNGLLNRSPMLGDNDQEGPDDYYGVFSACKELDNTVIPRTLLGATIRYFGFLNNNKPGTPTLSSFLVRQPQFLACMVSAAFPSWLNPLHLAIRMVALPLYLVTALIIAFSCMFADIGDSDSRRLGWHTIHATKSVSLACWLASKIWFRRLYRAYGNDGMLAVARIYYQKQHPFSRYWVTE